MNLHDLTVSEAVRLLRERSLSSVELTGALLQRIESVDTQVKAFLTLMADEALLQAELADEALASGEGGLLTGIPVAIKDVISIKGTRTTCGSRILENYIPPFDATVVCRLREAGAIFVGKTNTDEFAMGSSTENSAYFTTHNPWDLGRVPGGSSGGSASAVAAGEALAALGSDTGGSVRQPAAFCGVVGLKPTYGRVSRYGLVAFASSLDQIGPFTRTVEDTALILQCISGQDPDDSTSIGVPVPDYVAEIRKDVKGLRVGIPKEYFVEGIEPGVEKTVREAIGQLQDLGMVLEEVSLPHTKYALPTYYLIAPAEASSNLARYDGVKYGLSAPDATTLWESYMRTRERGFGPEVKRRIMLGTYALSSGYYDAYYLKAQKVRTLMKQDFDAVFERCDVIAAPATPTVPFRIGERVADPIQMYLSDMFTIPANMAGLPALSVPCGFIDGLPIGLQVIGKAFDESTALRVAYAYEQSTDWHKRRPPLGEVAD
ncbi:MAG: Asp-tRNA(Asn)/Glu-tRNA(Gln) amidotransferase subunit GatA [Chloroflexi bacterium]|nr:Asp-tRNA(Asn)/Glu-tRNA(Gln) amidotransferase subunit GatA [Chloroflexota bacterium]